MPSLVPPSLSRRQFLRSALQLGAVAAAPAAYGHWVEARWFEVNQREVAISPPSVSKAEPIRLLHLSDFHADSASMIDYLNEAVTAGLALDPDLICVTGDFIHRHVGILPGLKELLQRLTAKPTFVVLGNHDGWLRSGVPDSHKMRAFLPTTGVRLLHNENTQVTIRGRTLELVGVGDIWTWECEPTKAFPATVRPGRPERIVLSHNPDSKEDLAPFEWDLCLCGHTHGGQIGLPIIQGIAAPVKATRYVEGLHWYEDRLIHISRGLGNLYGVRILCRPEINLLTLV